MFKVNNQPRRVLQFKDAEIGGGLQPNDELDHPLKVVDERRLLHDGKTELTFFVSQDGFACVEIVRSGGRECYLDEFLARDLDCFVRLIEIKRGIGVFDPKRRHLVAKLKNNAVETVVFGGANLR